MIIYPVKQYNPINGAEFWLNPAPFILEERDLGIVHDICQGTATPYIYDPELARSTENEIEKRAIQRANEMIKNEEVR